MRRLRDKFASGIDSAIDVVESPRGGDEVEEIAAERIRNGAAERTQDGAEALREIGIQVHRS